MVDSVAAILHISSDSAYRRIRGETPIVLDEARELCEHFKLSLDHVLNVAHASMLFQHVRINNATYNYQQYLAGLLKQMQMVDSFRHKEIIYRTKDMPIFHNFYYKPLIAFRYFFWMKTIIQHPDFKKMEFSFGCLPPAILELSQQITRQYTLLPSTEIWNTECINAAISQIEFYKDSGYFESAADIRIVYEALEETMYHIKHQAEYGNKFMPGENSQLKKNNYSFFYNRVVLGDNTILAITDKARAVFLNYDGLNYLTTTDNTFCDQCYEDLQSLIRRSTIISETSEKQRNIFFGIMLNKIIDRIKAIN